MLILERGRPYPPGSFPRNPYAMAQNVWDPSEGLFGMFDLWSFRSLDALVASGVGGGSLIYANVLLRKSPECFVQNGADGEDWPITRADLDPHYDVIEKELSAQPYPFDRAPYAGTGKTALMRDAASTLKLDWFLPNLAVSFANGGSDAVPGSPIHEAVPNVHRRPRMTCVLCGECDIGCNFGSKNTTDLTLISRAVNDGAVLRSLAEAREIHPVDGGGYEIRYCDLSPGDHGTPPDPAAPLRRVRSRIVVLAAGALGSTYLLLRNRQHLPNLSDALGTRFSGNGDFLAFIEGTSDPAKPETFIDSASGPVITSAIKVPDRLEGGSGRGYYIQDGGLPAFGGWLVEATGFLPMMRRIVMMVWRYISALWHGAPDSNLSAELGTALGRGAGKKWSLPVLGMGRDVAGGRMGLRDKWLDVDWPALPSRSYFETLRNTMRDIARVSGAKLIKNPLWLLRRTITVHPLGGCPMGRSPATGVVDAHGEVFGHPGLFVVDGAAMPGPVGANPSLTIAAFADRCAATAAARFTHLPDRTRGDCAMTRTIPLFTLAGVPDCETSTHYVSTEDMLGLSLIRFKKSEAKDVVMIVHGLTTSSDMFIMPEHENLVRFLHGHGFPDVWTFDYRMSNRHPYNLTRHRYTMDHIALFDFPPAIAKIREVCGNDVRIHVISHCLGAVSFTIGLFGGVIQGVSSVIANSAALTPRVPRWSKFKLKVAPFLVDYVINEPYLAPNWSEERGLTPGKIVSKLVSLAHRECDNRACHMLSFMWGTGNPALYSHDKLADITHDRGGDLYGPTSPQYYRHVNKMVAHGHAVKLDPNDQSLKRLPDDYMALAHMNKVPVLLTTGDNNNVFTNSNVVCFEKLDRLTPGLHELAVFPSYGHQDVFMGKDVARDIFPRMLEFLSKHAHGTPLERVA